MIKEIAFILFVIVLILFVIYIFKKSKEKKKSGVIWIGAIIGAVIGGILSFPLFTTLLFLEVDNPWTEQGHDGICPLHAEEYQYRDEDGLSLTGIRTSCEWSKEQGYYSDDGEVFGGHLVCYNNISYITDWKCITPVIYYPFISSSTFGGESTGLLLLLIPFLLIHGAFYGFIIGAIIGWIIVRKNEK